MILAVWFSKYWPGAHWKIVPRAEVLKRAGEVARQFGFDSSKTTSHITTSVSKSLAYYAQQHPADENARTISPLTERVTFVSTTESAEVGIDSAGLPIYWNARTPIKPTKPAVSESDAAQQAFTLMSGSSSPQFSAPSRSMGDDPNEEEYVWKKLLPEHSDVREQIKVVVKGTSVQQAERKVALVSDEDADSETGDNRGYWTVLAAIFWTLCTIANVAIYAIYLLWLIRRSMNHRFPLTMAIAAFAVMLIALFAGSDGSSLFNAIPILCIVAVGRGISPGARPKWMSLEQLSWLAPVAKSTGESLAAGVLCSPMLVAIPFLIAGCGLFGQSTVVVPQDLEVLYSRIPVLDSLNVPSVVYALGFFGFGVPVLGRMFRYRWLRWAIVLPLGTVFFANSVRVVTGPLPAPLMAGFCTLALFGFLYKYFDLLAVLTLQLTSGIVLSMLMLAHTGGSVGPFVLVLACLLGVAFWFATRGQAVATGDPRAVSPELGFFRAEREKLQAEFSVARRAQEGMLPRHPPEIPGYSLAASCTPSLEVGGDLYDFLELPDGRIGLGVADVSGKGVPAALYMTLTKGLLASVSQDGEDLATVVEQVNKHLHSVTRKKVFVTMALGFLDAEKRVLQYVRAGHNPMVWRQREKDTTTLVSPSGLGMGITASAVFRNQMRVAELALAEGDAVVFYSDGITEAMNSQLEQFGEQRLMDVVAQTDYMDAAQTHDLILSAVREFLGGVHPQDDMTLVVLRVKDERMMVSG
jgi:hypothetical protein